MGHNTVECAHRNDEAMKRATSDKDNYVGDPEHFRVPARIADFERARSGQRE